MKYLNINYACNLDILSWNYTVFSCLKQIEDTCIKFSNTTQINDWCDYRTLSNKFRDNIEDIMSSKKVHKLKIYGVPLNVYVSGRLKKSLPYLTLEQLGDDIYIVTVFQKTL